MNQKPASRLRLFNPIICMTGILSAMSVCAAGNTLIPTDSNTGLMIENAVSDGNTTTLLFWTYPHIGDAGAGKECPLNFYTVSLQPGLPAAAANLAARDVCGNSLSKARLLANDDVLILAVDRFERWHDRVQLSSQKFSDLPVTSKMGINVSNGGQWHAMTSSGDVVLAVPARAEGGGYNAAVGLDIVSLDADAGVRWQSQLREPGQTLMVEKLWVTNGGGALLHTSVIAADYANLSTRNLLYFIDANGVRRDALSLTVEDPQPDLAQMVSMTPAEVQREMQRMSDSQPESIRKLEVDARAEGGFDVLLQREGGQDGREGYFLMRFGADGNLQNEKNVTDQLTAYGLDDVSDFRVDGSILVLLSRVAASQTSAGSQSRTWSQNVIASIDLREHTVETRLLPLDQRYLPAAMEAGDEGLQYLANWPGGEPVLLSQVGGVPLAIAMGRLSSRSALILDEATGDLPAYTEAFDRQRNDAARQAAREQRKTDQADIQAQLNADLAAAAGMTPEQFAALSNADRKLALTVRGNYDAISAAGIKQTSASRASAPAATADTQDLNTRIAAAMAQAQQDLPPEMAEQITAALAQVQQQAEASGLSLPAGMPSAATIGSEDDTEADANTFSMTVVDVFEVSGVGVVITGKVDSGSVKVGDKVCLVSANIGTRIVKVEAIEQTAQANLARAGDMPAITFSGIDKKDVSRSDQLHSSCSPTP